ncbi:MAG: gliding motility-associated C-terminal domain-containing protein, partial [Bacteroidales bacterium]|nr:gliding motility-associated C-terminal domain-containing protein [Bacteroidales bacterium]
IKIVPVKVLFPNAFSPNNDGVNDIFRARITGIVYDFQMAIYSRYGQRVFYCNNISFGWDGTYKGTKCPVDTYLLEASYVIGNDIKKEKKILTGYLHLIR